MRNGGGKHDASSARAHEKPHRRGLDIVTKPSSEARKRIGAWGEMLARQAKDHPGRTVAVALGAGYVLGGGLFSRLTARIFGTGIRIGFRMIVVPLMTERIIALGESMLNRDVDAREDNDSPSHSRSQTRSHQQHSNQKET